MILFPHQPCGEDKWFPQYWEKRLHLPDCVCDWSCPWLSQSCALLVLSPQSIHVRMTCGSLSGPGDTQHISCSLTWNVHLIIGRVWDLFPCSVASFSKSRVSGSQQWGPARPANSLSPHTPEQAWRAVFPQTCLKCLTFGLKITLAICRADFLSRCQLGMFVWGICFALKSDFLGQCLGYRKYF